MLITLCYVYLWVRFHKCYSALIRSSLRRLHSGSFGFSLRSSGSSGPASAAAPAGHRHAEDGHTHAEDRVFLQLGDKTVYVTEPQACDDLSQWTVLLGSSLLCPPPIENISFIIEATGHRAGHSAHTSNKKVLKWSDYCLPLARSPGQPFRAVAQASVDNFSRLGVAFIEDRLHLDNGLLPSKIVPVLLQESTLSELLEKQCPQTSKPDSLLWFCRRNNEEGVARPLTCRLSVDHQRLQCRKGSLLLAPELKRRLEERRGSEPLCSKPDLGPTGDSSDHSLGSHHHMEGHGHHLHLSSCHECLELENSTILSVKYASAENIPDLPDDNSVGLDSGDETLDEVEHDASGVLGQSGRFDSKPPNVLVYTGGCQERFQAVRQLLSECINMENNIIYPLLPQQALSDPWLDNTRLLVLAEEETLNPQLQTRFLTYLSQGGRVLGLSSTLCPAGLCLEVRERRHRQVSQLSFTREDSTELELNLLASGKVYIRDTQGGGEVELWGELKGDTPHQRDMVIVRVTHEADGGEAVLCQVHLEISPDSTNLTTEAFDQLKVSNALRYEVLTEILTSLGLSCEINQTPAPSPVHLLATSQEAKATFLKWLQTRTNQNGLLTLPKASLRMVSHSELHSEDESLLPGGSLALVTDSPECQSSEKFSMETYSKNLKSSLLGNTVLYAEVATSTMDLFEGLNLHLPKDVGLIIVAARQTQGRGRGRNAWLSPVGCAMFTLGVQVELGSRLGQRIPFLQHLAALAVVEAVRTLPGYEDIDLRVKWPNDIYYSNLMKLGGVLVTSTVLGSTFHLLIGCGFSVTNTNPTVCINDLVHRHNVQNNCSLQPLSSAQLIARTVSCLEALISSFQQGGPDAVLPTYYKRWLHSGTRVRLWSEDGLEADVVGLDQNGFLQVHSKEQGVVSLEPDGNSFDMMKNLVVTKQR
ncbi:biotin--protein ligase isoform X1 [Larimichthys crocea]|uniref:biotin--protein ligase isoform X1 n=1 Tax=Larimichthys crocea TaxID=215358 RepID=UPI000F600A8C|nr:biotin--protein ligase isoform X1 [Larimichthys crocea]